MTKGSFVRRERKKDLFSVSCEIVESLLAKYTSYALINNNANEHEY